MVRLCINDIFKRKNDNFILTLKGLNYNNEQNQHSSKMIQYVFDLTIFYE